MKNKIWIKTINPKKPWKITKLAQTKTHGPNSKRSNGLINGKVSSD